MGVDRPASDSRRTLVRILYIIAPGLMLVAFPALSSNNLSPLLGEDLYDLAAIGAAPIGSLILTTLLVVLFKELTFLKYAPWVSIVFLLFILWLAGTLRWIPTGGCAMAPTGGGLLFTLVILVVTSVTALLWTVSSRSRRSPTKETGDKGI